MQSTLNQPDNEAWTQLAPLLDDAMNDWVRPTAPRWCCVILRTNPPAKLPLRCGWKKTPRRNAWPARWKKLRARFVKRGRDSDGHSYCRSGCRELRAGCASGIGG